MPRSPDPDKYPPDFVLLLDRAQAGPVAIPDDRPAGLRGYIQAFLRACERDPALRDRAKATQATSHTGDPADPDPMRHGPHVLVQRRAESRYAKRVAAALGTSTDAEAAAAAAALLRRLEPTP